MPSILPEASILACALSLTACSSGQPSASSADVQIPAASDTTTTTKAPPPAAPTTSSDAAGAATTTTEDPAALAAQDIAAGSLNVHPYKWDLTGFISGQLCGKKMVIGWSGDGEILITDGVIVWFEFGDASHKTKVPELKGKKAPPIPPELLPLFKKPVAFDVGCM